MSTPAESDGGDGGGIDVQPTSSIAAVNPEGPNSAGGAVVGASGLPTPAATITATVTVVASNSAASSGQASATVAAAGSDSGGKKFDTGAVAGAAVGGAIGAAILTALICWLLFRKRNRRDRHSGGFAGGNTSSYSEKALPKSPTAPELTWQKHLPQSADDKTIRNAVKTLFDQVEVHVENYYQDSPIQVTEQLQDSLAQVNSPHLPETAVTLLPRARNQLPILKHCLLSYITASISTDDTSTQTLLPPEFSSLPRLLRSSPSTRKPIVFDQALSQWRVLTAYVRPQPKSDSTYLSQRDTLIASAASAFTAAFAPFAKPNYSDAARHQNVVEIFKAGAEAGVLVFAQPSSFQFVWERPGGAGAAGANTEVVVAPAFVKTGDETGEALVRAQSMVEMVLARI